MELKKDYITDSKISSLKTSSGFYSLNMLKNSDDNFFPIYIFNGFASFEEYGYTTCSNSNINVFNADNNSKIEFNFYSLFENNDIIFLNNSNRNYIQLLMKIRNQ